MPALQPAAAPAGTISRYRYPHQFEDVPGLLSALERVLLEGDYVLGPEVARFESAFAAYCGAAHAIGVNTGTDALVIALKALGIGAGDKVIAPANTFHATVAAIELAGATPLLVDARADTFLLDVNQLEAAAGDAAVRAVIPVHLFGKTVPMLPLVAWARRRGVHVVEDAAQAHGALIDGQRAGSFGSLGCFSFHPSKNLAAAGDAGAIITQDRALAERCRRLRSLGQSSQNRHEEVGLNSKLDSLQALILGWKLPRLDEWNRARARVARWYRAALSGLPVGFQSHDEDGVSATHVYHLFQVRTPYRDALLSFFKTRGVDAVVRYPVPIHLQPAFAHHGWRRGDYPVAEALADELLCLPIRPDMQEDEVSYVAGAAAEFFETVSTASRHS